MIIGIGTDIIEIGRVGQSIERSGQVFLDGIFTKGEQEYCSRFAASERNYAARFAAKEAVAKAFGTGIGPEMGWHDIEVINRENGEPVIHLSEKVLEQFPGVKVMISLSHNKESAIAFVIVTKD